MDDVRVHTGTMVVDLLLPRAESLKDRRGPLRALVQRLRNQEFAVAQVGPADLHQRVFLAVAAVSGDSSTVAERLDVAERMIFASEFEVGELRRDGSVITYSSLGN